MEQEHTLVIEPSISIEERIEIERVLKKLNYKVLGGGQSFNDIDCFQTYINFIKK